MGDGGGFGCPAVSTQRDDYRKEKVFLWGRALVLLTATVWRKHSVRPVLTEGMFTGFFAVPFVRTVLNNNSLFLVS